MSNQKRSRRNGNHQRRLPSSDLFAAVELLTEAREACAACFRVIAATNDPTITERLDTELKMAGVKEGFGVRIQNFIAANDQRSDTRQVRKEK
jgi:hypothetical protein